MIAVTNKQDNKKSQVDPTEGVHKLLSFQQADNEESGGEGGI